MAPNAEVSPNMEMLTDRGVGIGALEFIHEGIPFSAEIDPKSVEYYQGRVVGTFVIQSEGTKYARVTGAFESTEDGAQFTVKESNNLTHPNSFPHNKNLPRVTGLIQKFVSEIVHKGIVAAWVSDVERTEGANKMYERLKEDKSLEVSFEPGYNRLLPQYRNVNAFRVTLAN